MPVEIERKFLVLGDAWRSGRSGHRFCQGFLARSGTVSVRVRRAGPVASLTVKGQREGILRPEFEYPIPVEEAEHMLAHLCRRPLIEKTRYEVPYAGLLWHVDEFAAPKAGLVMAEVELEDPGQQLVLPPWVGSEVTHDTRFRQSTFVEQAEGRL